MKITTAWLKTNGACAAGRKWFAAQKKSDGGKVVRALIGADHLDWANWTVVRLITRKQKVRYALFAAEQVIEIYERQCPGDKRPREAIEAAKAWLRSPSKARVNAAANAANAAASAAYSSVAYAYTAATAAYAASAAASAAANAAYASVAYACTAEHRAIQGRILEFGLGLLSARKKAARS